MLTVAERKLSAANAFASYNCGLAAFSMARAAGKSGSNSLARCPSQSNFESEHRFQNRAVREQLGDLRSRDRAVD